MTLLILLGVAVLIVWVIKSILASGGADRRYPDADYTPGLIDSSGTDDGNYHHPGACSPRGDADSSDRVRY